MSIDALILSVAQPQFGIVGTAQLVRLGIGRSSIKRRRQSGLLLDVHRGVFRVAAVQESFMVSVWAASLAFPDATISHVSAGRFWGLVRPESDSDLHEEHVVNRMVHMTIPADRRCDKPGFRISRVDLNPADRVRRSSLWITSPERTIFDLRLVLGPTELERALDLALRNRQLVISRLAARVDQGASHRMAKTAVLRKLIDERANGQHRLTNEFERKGIRALVKGGLPRPIPQYRVSTPEGTRFIDLAYPDKMVGIEMDSWQWHAQRSDWRADRTRNSMLTAMGWRIISATLDDVKKTPERFASLVRRAIE
jgi:very-short-patch-repair endonuclease